MTLNHEHVAELLGPYVRGELNASESERVTEHLEGCADCRLEERGLRALVAEPVEPMSDIERASLHRRLRTELDVTGPQETPQRLTWLPGALTAAALLLAVVVGVQFAGGGGDDDSGGGLGVGAPAELGDGPQPVTLSLGRAGLEPGGAGYSGDDLEASEEAPEAEPAAPGDQAPAEGEETAISNDGGTSDSSTLRAQKSTENKFTRYARSGDAFVSFARAYTAEDVDVLRDGFTARLADDAPVEARPQVVQCADFVVDSRPYPTLPVAAAHGRYKKQESLLLGFVWTREETGPLDNYMLFVWPKGSCESPTHSQIGRIRTGKS